MLLNDTFNTPYIQRRLDLSRGSRPTYSRLDPSRERRPYPLLPVSRPLTGETSPHIVCFLAFHLHVLFFPPFSSNSLQSASLSRRCGTHTHASSETCYYQLPFFPQEGVLNHPFTTCNEFLTIHDVLSFQLPLPSHVFLYTFLHTSNLSFSSHFSHKSLTGE